MVNPEGTANVNPDYINHLADEIRAINVCSILQAEINKILADIQTQITAIENQILALIPLTTIPSDLGSVITWITNQIAPYARALAKLEAEIVDWASAIANLTSAVEETAASIENCTVEIATVSFSV